MEVVVEKEKQEAERQKQEKVNELKAERAKLVLLAKKSELNHKPHGKFIKQLEIDGKKSYAMIH